MSWCSILVILAACISVSLTNRSMQQPTPFAGISERAHQSLPGSLTPDCVKDASCVQSPASLGMTKKLPSLPACILLVECLMCHSSLQCDFPMLCALHKQPHNHSSPGMCPLHVPKDRFQKTGFSPLCHSALSHPPCILSAPMYTNPDMQKAYPAFLRFVIQLKLVFSCTVLHVVISEVPFNENEICQLKG